VERDELGEGKKLFGWLVVDLSIVLALHLFRAGRDACYLSPLFCTIVNHFLSLSSFFLLLLALSFQLRPLEGCQSSGQRPASCPSGLCWVVQFGLSGSVWVEWSYA
jgi:hypothetical protein